MFTKNALLSVYHKDGIVEFARELIKLGWRIFASGGTAKTLTAAGVAVTDVAELEKLGIPFFDLACVDLYPLEKAIADPKATVESVTEMTDIGGPTMLLSAAKGRRIVIGDPKDRQIVIDNLKTNGEIPKQLRLELAAKAEYLVSKYRLNPARYLSEGLYDGTIGIRIAACKGENAWQRPAGVYSTNFNNDQLAIPETFILVEGEAPSAINWFDLSRALQTATHLAAGFEINFGKFPKLAIGVKHSNACGVGINETNCQTAIINMLLGDPLAIYGGFVLLNFPVGKNEADLLVHQYLKPGEKRRPLDGIAAPTFTDEAKEILVRKGGRCRLLVNPVLAELNRNSLDTQPIIRTLRSGFVLEPNYTFVLIKDHPEIKVYPEEQRELIDWEKIILAWAIGSTSNSNTITIVGNGMLYGNGVGQKDRVGCAELALWGAKRSQLDVYDATAYSDSFFPFPDGPMVLAKAGITTIFASSGSIRDQEVIAACLEKGVTLVMCPDAICRGFAFHS